MSSVIENFFQKNCNSRAWFSLQLAQKTAQISHPRNVAQKHGENKSLVLARISEPLVVGFPLFLGRLAGQVRLAGLLENEPVGGGMRFGISIANTGTAYLSIKCHRSLPCVGLVPQGRPLLKHLRAR